MSCFDLRCCLAAIRAGEIGIFDQRHGRSIRPFDKVAGADGCIGGGIGALWDPGKAWSSLCIRPVPWRLWGSVRLWQPWSLLPQAFDEATTVTVGRTAADMTLQDDRSMLNKMMGAHKFTHKVITFL